MIARFLVRSFFLLFICFLLFCSCQINESHLKSRLELNIPDQIISFSQKFKPIDLNKYMDDYAKSDIKWRYHGNVELSVKIDNNNLASIHKPAYSWHGKETIAFMAYDSYGLIGFDEVTFISVSFSPLDGSKGHNIITTRLAWSFEADSFDVYLVTDNPPKNLIDKVNTKYNTFNFDGLAYNTTYYWRIVAHLGEGIISFPIQ